MTRDRGIALAIGLFASLLFVQSLGFDFAMDDSGLIKRNPLVQSPDRFLEIFYTDYWFPKQKSGLYRPLPKATYALNYAIDGLNPRGYHAGSVILHGVTSGLVFLLLLRITGDRRLAGVSALLFAAHAAHTEVAANTTFGRPETMASILTILAMLAYLARGDGDPRRRRMQLYAVSLVCFFLALLCKESSVTMIGLLALYDFCYRDDASRPFIPRVWATLRARFVPSYLGYCVLVAAYMGLRAIALAGAKSTPPHITLDNPIVGMDLPWRPINALYVSLCHYLWKLFYPATLSHDYSYDAIPLIKAWADPRLLLTLAACAALVALLVWSYRRSTTLFFAVASYVISFSVVSNVIVLIGTILAERLLYFPSVWFCMAAAWALISLADKLGGAVEGRRRLILAGLVVLLVGAHVGRSLDRLQDWKDEYTLFRHDAEVVPRSAKVLNNAGAISIKYKDYEAGLDYLRRAIDLNPLGYPVPYYTAALALTTLGRDTEAAKMYEMAILTGDRDPFTRNNLGFILVDRDMDVDRGVALIEEAVASMPSAAEFRDSLALGYLKQGRFDEALVEIDKAIELLQAKGKEPKPPHLEHREQIVEAIRVREQVKRR